MSCPPPYELRCEIDSVEEPIRGRLENGAGRSVEFRGWIELAAALTDLLRDAEPTSFPSRSEAQHHEGI